MTAPKHSLLTDDDPEEYVPDLWHLSFKLSNSSDRRAGGLGIASASRSRFWRVIAVTFSLSVLLAFCRAQAFAQQPSATATPNLNWCPGVPISPSPPQWNSEVWASTFKECASDRSALGGGERHNMEIDCYHACMSAVGLRGTSKNRPRLCISKRIADRCHPVAPKLVGGFALRCRACVDRDLVIFSLFDRSRSYQI